MSCYATSVIYMTQTPLNNYNNKLSMTNHFSFSETAVRSWLLVTLDMKLVHYTMPEEGSGLELIPRLVSSSSPQVSLRGLSFVLISSFPNCTIYFIENVLSQSYGDEMIKYYALILLITFIFVFVTQLVLLIR